MLKTETLKLGEIGRKELVDYFLKVGGITEDDEVIKGTYWEVTVGSQTWTKFGSLRIRHILITISVEDKMYDDFIAAFRLNFLRCGG